MTFTEVVAIALAEALKEPTAEKMAEVLPTKLRDAFRRAGYEVHAIGSCVRPKLKPGEVLGREMTPAERELLLGDEP